MVLFLFSFKDITDTHGKGHHSSKKDGRLPAPVAKKRFLICLPWAWFTSRPSSVPWLSFSPCTRVHHCHIPAGSLVWVEIPSLNSHSVFAPGSLGGAEVCLQVEPGHSLLQTQHTFPQEINTSEHSISNTALPIRFFFLLLLPFIHDALISITVWQKTRSTGGRAAPASARPGNAAAPCCTSWPASSQGEAKERSTWVGWALFFFIHRSTDPAVHLFIYPAGEKKRSYSDMQCPQSPLWIINADI